MSRRPTDPSLGLRDARRARAWPSSDACPCAIAPQASYRARGLARFEDALAGRRTTCPVRPRRFDMKVLEVLTPDVAVARPDDPLLSAIRRMREEHVGAVVVVADRDGVIAPVG